MTAYYNEFDPFAAEWLRELIKAGVIAPGVVDDRSILDVTPEDLKDFNQCHFFAGIGVWSYALRNAGWDDSRPVWTGSCPCQPFSAAGARSGFADERHLWPAFHYLIEQCRPGVVFGEQVASKDGRTWLDHVQTDMENLGFAIGAGDICAAGFGAPHIRQRLFFVAERVCDTNNTRPQGWIERGNGAYQLVTGAGSLAGGLAESDRRQCDRRPETPGRDNGDREDAGRPEGDSGAAGSGGAGWLGNAVSESRERDTGGISGTETKVSGEGQQHGYSDQRPEHAGAGMGGLEHANRIGSIRHPQTRWQAFNRVEQSGENNRPGPTNGFWRAADWLYCRDEKWRPVEPGTQPLAAKSTNRVGRLRGYGNAINAQVAQAFIESYLDV